MQALVDEKLLEYQTTTLQWEWYEVDIQSRNVADNVADAVSQRLRKVEPQNLLLLQIAARISQSFDQGTVQFALLGLRELDIDLTEDVSETLQLLVEIGLLENPWADDIFAFCHDQTQQAAYKLIPEDLRKPIQVAIGKWLIEGMDSWRIDDFLFTAVELCGLRCNEMGTEERHTFAFWAFLAGTNAMKQGAFHNALQFLEQTIYCIGDSPFEKDMELAFPIFCSAIEASYATANFDKVAQYAKQVNDQSSIPAPKKSRVANMQLKVCFAEQKKEEGAEIFRRYIKSLGAGNFPRNQSKFTTIYHVIGAVRTAKKQNREQLLALPKCTNPAIAAAASAYSSGCTTSFALNPELYVIASCMAFHWSIKHGVTKDAPSAWNAIALVMAGALGDVATAMELGDSALALCDMYGYKEALPCTLTCVYGFINHWNKPMQQFSAPMHYGFDLSMRLGLIDDAAILVGNIAIMVFLTWERTLPETTKEMKIPRQTGVRNVKQGTMLIFVDLCLQFGQNLMTPCEDPTALVWSSMDEKDIRRIADEPNDILLHGYTDFYKLQLLVYFDQPGKACEFADKVVGFGFTFGQGSHVTTRCTFMIGMACILAYIRSRRGKHLRGAKRMVKRGKNWIAKGNPNVLHLFSLLRAEVAVVSKKYDKAEQLYWEAISTSKRAGFRLDFAYVNQRLALYCDKVKGDRFAATRYMEEAIRSYIEYGALGIVDHITNWYPELTNGCSASLKSSLRSSLTNLSRNL